MTDPLKKIAAVAEDIAVSLGAIAVLLWIRAAVEVWWWLVSFQ